MKIDLSKSVIDQYDDFINKTGNKNKSAREFEDSDLIELVELFLTSIDYGEHSNNSYDHKIMAYEDIAQNIINNIESAKYFIQVDTEKYNTVESINHLVYSLIFHAHMYKCRYCGEYFKTKYEEGGYLTAIDKIKVGHFANHYPPKSECYKDGITKVKIKMKSNKFVIANDLRTAFKDQSIDFEDGKYDINTKQGRINCTKEFAKNDIMCINTGNTSIGLYTKNKNMILTDMYYQDLDDYYFNEPYRTYIEEVTKFIDTEKYKYKGDKNKISCGLWWAMGASACDLNMSDISSDYVIHNVKKGDIYIIEFEYHKGNFYKFYKYEETNEKEDHNH